MGWFLDRLNRIADAIKKKHAEVEAMEPPKWLVELTDKGWDIVPAPVKVAILSYIETLAKKYGAEFAKSIIRKVIKVLEETIGGDIDGDGRIGS